jgi:hypothetical protein
MDDKQYTGLSNCQARSENKLDFYFNAALSAINLAKQDWLSNKTDTPKPFLWLITKHSITML